MFRGALIQNVSFLVKCHRGTIIKHFCSTQTVRAGGRVISLPTITRAIFVHHTMTDRLQASMVIWHVEQHTQTPAFHHSNLHGTKECVYVCVRARKESASMEKT